MIKEEKFSKFWKLKCVNTKKKLKGIEHLIWPYKHWLGNILEFSFEQKVIQKHPRILRLKVSKLKQREVSGLLNRILKRDFYVLGLTQGSEGKGAIRQLKLFLSSKRIWLKIVQVSWTSDGCSILLCSSLFPKKYWWIVLVPEGNQWRIVFFTTVNLFEVNWFATGNKMFLGQIFRNAQGKTTIQIQSCFEFGWRVTNDEAKQKLKVEIFQREKFGKILN